MHYQPHLRDHGLAHDPFLSLVVPRPIGWISSVSRDGVVNLAPYSYYNTLAGRPPLVMFSSLGRKDSLRNAEETGEFVVNLATWELREAMNASSAEFGAGESEPAAIGLEMAPSRHVRPPRVARTPAALECRYVKTVELPDEDGSPLPYQLVIGRVIGVYIDDAIIVEGKVKLEGLGVLSRLGYMEYGVLDTIFSMDRPGGVSRHPTDRR